MMNTRPLPLSSCFVSPDDYVPSLLSFITSSELFNKLCGGVHILDFLTKEPELYDTIIPTEWRQWFQLHDVGVILDLFLREDDDTLKSMITSPNKLANGAQLERTWRGSICPPLSLVAYIQTIRKHSLNREFKPIDKRKAASRSMTSTSLPRHVTVGMKPKKAHEVENFAKYIDDFAAYIDTSTSHRITHVVDFGSGQNYLGRALASPPYSRKVVALEGKKTNITGARSMDVTAKLAEKEKTMRNKKQYRSSSLPSDHMQPKDDSVFSEDSSSNNTDIQCQGPIVTGNSNEKSNIQYIETFIKNGDLSKAVSTVWPTIWDEGGRSLSEPQLIVISLHSCGNLVHHGLRSLIVNSSVKAVAMIGCCYNLVTERLGPPTYKLPSLRAPNHRLDQTSNACDAHGFPMSERLAKYKHAHGEGIRMNITARMMACQAPQNWTDMECESFFTRHFYRALLQRILFDRGIVGRPQEPEGETIGGSPRGWTGAGPALTIGSLRKACYVSFIAYVRGAISKLVEDKQRGAEIEKAMQGLTDEHIELYEERYRHKKKELSIVWSLMAFSAAVVESTILVDRWLYLKEQPEVMDCWVESVFDYKQSPRNLAVVGIKK